MTPGRPQGVGGIVDVSEHESGTAERRPQQPGAQPEDVVQCAHPRHHVAGSEADGAGGFGGGVQEVGVREFDSARFAGGARGVEDGEGVFGGRRGCLEIAAHPVRQAILPLEDPVVVPEILFTHRDQVAERRQFDQKILEDLQIIDAVGVLGRNRTRRSRVPERVPQFGKTETRIHRNDERSDPGGGVDRYREFGPRRKHQGNPVPRADPEIRQRCGQRLGLVVHFAK